MNIGTKVRTLYEHSETAAVVKPRANEGVPSADWFIIRWDADGKRACCHRDVLAIRND